MATATPTREDVSPAEVKLLIEELEQKNALLKALDQARAMLSPLLKFFGADVGKSEEQTESTVPLGEETDLTKRAVDQLKALKDEQKQREDALKRSREALREITEKRDQTNTAQRVLTELQDIKLAAKPAASLAKSLEGTEVSFQKNIGKIQQSSDEIKENLYNQFRNRWVDWIPGIDSIPLVNTFSKSGAQKRANQVFETLSEKLAKGDSRQDIQKYINKNIGSNGNAHFRELAYKGAMNYAQTVQKTQGLIQDDPARLREFKDFLRNPSLENAQTLREESQNLQKQYKDLADGKDLQGLMDLEKKKLPPHERTLTNTLRPLQKLAADNQDAIRGLPLEGKTKELVQLLADGNLRDVGEKLSQQAYKDALRDDQVALKTFMQKQEKERAEKQKEVSQTENAVYNFRNAASNFASTVAKFFNGNTSSDFRMTGDSEKLREELEKANDIMGMDRKSDFTLALGQRMGEFGNTLKTQLPGAVNNLVRGTQENFGGVVDAARETVGHYFAQVRNNMGR
jgi:hypothetical protein